MQKERLALLALLAVHLHHVRVQVAFLHAPLRLVAPAFPVQAHARPVFPRQVRAFRPLVRRVLHFPAHLLLRLLVFHLLGDGLMDLS